MAAIFDLLLTLTSYGAHFSHTVLLDLENVVVAVGIPLLTSIQAEINVFYTYTYSL